MTNEFTFSITTTRFDEDYSPSDSSRATTNFANLARGEHRQQNLRNALTMIDRRFNDLAHWDNPNRDRYTVELEIVSVDLRLIAEDGEGFPCSRSWISRSSISRPAPATTESSATTSRRTSAITISAYGFRRSTIRRPRSPSPTTSAFCTASFSSISSIPRCIGSASGCRP